MDINLILKQTNNNKCSKCQQEINQGDIAWNNPTLNATGSYGDIEIYNGSTEAGTGHCDVTCVCPKCDSLVFNVSSWYPAIDDLEDLAHVLENDLEERKQ